MMEATAIRVSKLMAKRIDDQLDEFSQAAALGL
jgi:hypothetical protein